MENTHSRSEESLKILWILPEQMREELSKPLGPVISSGEVEFLRGEKVVSVGDVCSITLYQRDIIPHLAIVDGKTKRSPHIEYPGTAEDIVFVKNPESTITKELWDAIQKAFMSEKSTLIRVEGEEDLAALVCISLAPEGTYVLYGIPDKGMCAVKVSETTRRTAKDALSRMKKKTEA